MAYLEAVLAALPVHWDVVGIWVGSIGTVGAFVTGFVLLRQQGRDLEAAREDKRREPARRVSAWCVEVRAERDDMDSEGVPHKTLPTWRLGRPDPPEGEVSGAHVVVIRAINGGQEPVSDVWLRTADNWNDPPNSTSVLPIDVLEPGADRTFEIALPLSGRAFTTFYTGKPPVEIRFVDASGRGWHRLPKGELIDQGVIVKDGKRVQIGVWSTGPVKA
jgi:hypothetical protein